MGNGSRRRLGAHWWCCLGSGSRDSRPSCAISAREVRAVLTLTLILTLTVSVSVTVTVTLTVTLTLTLALTLTRCWRAVGGHRVVPRPVLRPLSHVARSS